MEPLSLKTRRLFAAFFFVLFIIILPVVVLYASGYRLQGLSLVSTGGIHISTPTSDVVIALNGEAIEHSNLFLRSFFIDNLEPGSYVIQATLDGYHPWSKTLVVESRLVTDVSMRAVPQPLRIFELIEKEEESSASTTPESSATSTILFLSPDELEEIADIFATTTPLFESIGTTTDETVLPSEDVEGGAELVIEDGNLLIRWTRSNQPPSSFCTRPSLCIGHFFLERGPHTVTDARFFGGAVLYRTLESGIFLVEADIREPRLLVNVYSTPGAEFRVIGGTLYIKDNGTFYQVERF